MASRWDNSRKLEYKMAEFLMRNDYATMSSLPPGPQQVINERVGAGRKRWDSREFEIEFAQLAKEVETCLPLRRKKFDTLPFKVPDRVRAVGPSFTDIYTPDIISLGFNRTSSGRGVQYKTACYRSFIKWYTRHHKLSSRERSDSSLNTSLGAAWEQFVEDLDLDDELPIIGRFYRIDITESRSAKKSLALDALFLVMFLRYCYNKCPEFQLPGEVYDGLHDETFYMLQAEASGGIWRDIFLLENQVPLRVLCKVWPCLPDMSSLELICPKKSLALFNDLLKEVMKDRYLKHLVNASSPTDGRNYLCKILSDKNFTEGEHLLDALHYVVCCSPAEQPKSDFSIKIDDEEAGVSPADTIPSAISLKKAGIRIKSEGCYAIHQIRLEEPLLGQHALIVPSLRILDRNECLSILRNLAVFETLCHNRDQAKTRIGPRVWNINHYLKLMTKLVQSPADVKLLKRERAIVVGHASHFDLYQIWNIMGKRLSCHHDESWSQLLLKLSDRCRDKRYQLFADIKRKCFGRWWATISWVAGALLLIMTGLQTAFTMAAYYAATSRYGNGN